MASMPCDEKDCFGRTNALSQGQIIKPGTGQPTSFRCDGPKSGCHVVKEGESLVLNALPTYVPPRSGDACRCPGGCGEGKGCNHTCRADGDSGQGFVRNSE